MFQSVCIDVISKMILVKSELGLGNPIMINELEKIVSFIAVNFLISN